MNSEIRNTNKSNFFQFKGSSLGSTINIIIITTIFSVAISFLMLFNYLQLANHDPIESEAMTALIERLADEPNNEQLRNEIRAFDLMARKAFFTNQWQIDTGGMLLLIGAIILVISLRHYFKLTAKIDEPETDPISQQASRILSSKWLLGIGGLLIVLAITASFLSTNQLNSYQAETTITDSDDDVIEVVDLTASNTESAKEDEPVATDEELKENPQELTTKKPEQLQAEEKIEAKPIVKAKQYPAVAELNKQYNTFRGALGHGVSFAKNIPSSWDIASGTNIHWKINVPLKGYSSPVIWNNKLFVTGANAQERWVYCYNSNSGELIWQQQANNISGSPSTAPKTTDDTGLAAPSVVCDGNSVVAIFGTGDIIAFDMDGNRIWAKNLGIPDNHYGHSSSLISWKEKVIVQYDTNKGGRLIALNIASGEIIWDIKRNSHISWASPILAEVNGKMQVITSAEPSVAGYDIETGKEHWKIDCMMGEVGPSPAFGNGLVFAANEYATLVAINPAKGEIVWENNEYLPEVASPVVADGLLIIGTTYSVLACYDVHTGNKYWETEYDDGFYSSPVVADGKIFATDMKGIVHILKLDRELQQIADLAIGEKCTTTPAFADGKIYIRGNETLFCIGK